MADTKDLFPEIENFASLLFNKDEIATIMGIPLEDLKQPSFDEACKRGWLKREADLRKAILKLAENGSSPAQSIAIEFLNNLKRDSI